MIMMVQLALEGLGIFTMLCGIPALGEESLISRYCYGIPQRNYVVKYVNNMAIMFFQKSFIQCFNVRKPKTIKRRPKVVFERPSTPPRKIYSQYDGKVENMWEELTPELVEDENVVVDMEAALDLPPCPSCNIPPTGTDVATEIAAGDLFDFERLCKPVCEAFVGEVLHNVSHPTSHH